MQIGLQLVYQIHLHIVSNCVPVLSVANNGVILEPACFWRSVDLYKDFGCMSSDLVIIFGMGG